MHRGFRVEKNMVWKCIVQSNRYLSNHGNMKYHHHTISNRLIRMSYTTEFSALNLISQKGDLNVTINWTHRFLQFVLNLCIVFIAQFPCLRSLEKTIVCIMLENTYTQLNVYSKKHSWLPLSFRTGFPNHLIWLKFNPNHFILESVIQFKQYYQVCISLRQNCFHTTKQSD